MSRVCLRHAGTPSGVSIRPIRFREVKPTGAQVAAAVAAQAGQATRRLRRHGLQAGKVTVVYATSRFRRGPTIPPTDCELAITAAATAGPATTWPGDGRYRFARSGVVLSELTPAGTGSIPLLLAPDRPANPALMDAIDTLRARYGPDIIRLGVTALAVQRHRQRSACRHL